MVVVHSNGKGSTGSVGGWGDGEMGRVGVWEKLKNVYPTITMQDYRTFSQKSK
ncbi:MAG: hypothetical protein F6K23_15300 [Okeania sp. SIO2C9]|uniref:hypothetical protein n=1 Tax=Okeania sp. SIO2C9 TaxID=2607791 RepID=UPI0013C28850|nr:hypothetical protein [Okeania sp. SIO2C9]NEQ74284.1 hypothetical protein [Okeania sp. SIO2C9]